MYVCVCVCVCVSHFNAECYLACRYGKRVGSSLQANDLVECFSESEESVNKHYIYPLHYTNSNAIRYAGI